MTSDQSLPVISFLASHGGSSARAIIAAMATGDMAAVPGILITNNADSGIHAWCQEQGFPCAHVSAKTHDDEDGAIVAALEQANTDIVVCSGYMKKIGPATLARFSGQILNIHPSLLPRHGGQGLYGDRVHAAVLAARDVVSGATVHVVTAEYDDGPVIGQSRVDVAPEETVASLRAKVQGTEPGLYIECLNRFLAQSGF